MPSGTREDAAPALKEIFNLARIRLIAKELSVVYPAFDSKSFVSICGKGLDELSIMQRIDRISEAMHETLPHDFKRAVSILRKLAPSLDHSFAAVTLSNYVAMYGQDDFETSMDALKFFTPFGTSEFAIRHFLKRDLKRTLKVMERWADDEDEHVRRLASEGSRPRLPWSFRIEALVKDATPTSKILEKLKADPSLYVRKSVANHLNDITKDNPQLALARIESWDLSNAHSAWIAKHALRSLIKKGDKRALTVIGAGEKAEVVLSAIAASPAKLNRGSRMTLSMTLRSTSKKAQRLVVDYAIHYVKKSGNTAPKVFKWKGLDLAPHASVTLSKSQLIQDFSTRVHYTGKHEVDIFVNGECLGKTFFNLMD